MEQTRWIIRAVVISQYGGPEVLVQTELPEPEPAMAEVLIRAEGDDDTFFGDGAARGRLPHPGVRPGLLGQGYQFFVV